MSKILLKYCRCGPPAVLGLLMWPPVKINCPPLLYRLENGSLTALGIGMKSLNHGQTLRWCSRSWVPLMHDNAGLMWQEYAGSTWRMKELIQLNGPHDHLT